MNVHEFQAKSILASYCVEVPQGRVATTPEDAAAAFEELREERAVVKAQIHAGGRGKAGGVKVIANADEARQFAASLLGRPLVTGQTGPAGRIVRRVLVEQACKSERELYVAMVVDRKAASVAIVASTDGGMEIEEVAAKAPERVLTELIDPAIGVALFQKRKIARALGVEGRGIGYLGSILGQMYKIFTDKDASLIEINPLGVMAGGYLTCLDAKMTFDDNALGRQPAIRELRDADEEDPAESEAARHGLSYVRLDGNIGCMVNGAGLAMATMDLVKHYGGEPANFLDVGGGADAEKVAAAFRILLSDPRVRAVLINIFGGIMRCDVLARGVVDAARQVKLEVPLVVRMEGTNVEEGRRILKESDIEVAAAKDMAEAARRVVEAAAAAR